MGVGDRGVTTPSSRPTLDNEIQAILEESRREGDAKETIEVLVGVREDLPEVDADTVVQQVAEDVNGRVSAAVGFGIYKLALPVVALDGLATADALEFIEYPAPDGGPALMGK